MALAGEVGELVAEFQWLTPEDSRSLDAETFARVRSPLADVTACPIRLVDLPDVDLVELANAELDESERRYDPDLFRGVARKAPPLTS
ncbi:nucleotide pyrophosphohydrolase [Microtetraspora fusca]|uniref:nucleotide pyrophosphohydrolase n=1 Tax=Microtetraspora fusca TaxID=1997 RepID=UPI0012FBB2D6|nr:nucleotide pyrophosphohydrolase [Microtetraspora fusca]